MTTTSVADFMRAEEQAQRLADQLEALAAEMAAYKTAHEALDDADRSVVRLATRIEAMTERLSDVIDALGDISTPEILRAQEAIAAAHRQEIERLEGAIEEESEWIHASLATVRSVALGGVALSLVTLVLLGWIALSITAL